MTFHSKRQACLTTASLKSLPRGWPNLQASSWQTVQRVFIAWISMKLSFWSISNKYNIFFIRYTRSLQLRTVLFSKPTP
ncbi:hypothetical protein vseg_015261 [Gypsophila vaccaria]